MAKQPWSFDDDEDEEIMLPVEEYPPATEAEIAAADRARQEGTNQP